MAIAIPIYMVVQKLELLNKYPSLILVHSAFTLPFTIWFLSLYRKNIPPQFEESALTDGCSRLQAIDIYHSATSNSGSCRSSYVCFYVVL